MRFKRKIELLKYLDYLIRSHSTGSPGELAKKLGVSPRSVYHYLTELKEMGAPVKWNPGEKTYHYEENVKLIVIVDIEYINSCKNQVPGIF